LLPHVSGCITPNCISEASWYTAGKCEHTGMLVNIAIVVIELIFFSSVFVMK
jgi:hypothetical protein